MRVDSEDCVLVDRADRVLRIVLNRLAKGNAIDLPLADQLATALTVSTNRSGRS
jgi:enoyl-CoA hydratase/carnithine racemase